MEEGYHRSDVSRFGNSFPEESMQTLDLPSEVQKLLDVLNSFPPEQQEALAAYYRAEAEHIRDVDARINALSEPQREKLRALLREGMESGPARPIDMEALKRRGRERLAAARKREQS